MTEYLPFLIPMFVAMDPFGQVPLFITISKNIEPKDKRKLLIEALITSLLLGAMFSVAGIWIFKMLGITIHDFKIGGGLIFMIIAILGIIGIEDTNNKTDLSTAGIVPLATPGIIGPAVIANIVMLSQQKSILFSISIYLTILLFQFLLLFNTKVIVKVIGNKGTVIISKIFAILLVAIAVMFIRQGIIGIINS